ncbi:unnamed protein product [Amoebophrya sp. A25]|nr:unnamed protein product [Amoebophrya sp. A25]|eukprot:GSA25T00000615001.1
MQQKYQVPSAAEDHHRGQPRFRQDDAPSPNKKSGAELRAETRAVDTELERSVANFRSRLDAMCQEVEYRLGVIGGDPKGRERALHKLNVEDPEARREGRRQLAALRKDFLPDARDQNVTSADAETSADARSGTRSQQQSGDVKTSDLLRKRLYDIDDFIGEAGLHDTKKSSTTRTTRENEKHPLLHEFRTTSAAAPRQTPFAAEVADVFKTGDHRKNLASSTSTLQQEQPLKNQEDLLVVRGDLRTFRRFYEAKYRIPDKIAEIDSHLKNIDLFERELEIFKEVLADQAARRAESDSQSSSSSESPGARGITKTARKPPHRLLRPRKKAESTSSQSGCGSRSSRGTSESGSSRSDGEQIEKDRRSRRKGGRKNDHAGRRKRRRDKNALPRTGAARLKMMTLHLSQRVSPIHHLYGRTTTRRHFHPPQLNDDREKTELSGKSANGRRVVENRQRRNRSQMSVHTVCK